MDLGQKAKLLFIPRDASPYKDLVIFLDNFQITPLNNAQNLGVVLNNQRSHFPHVAKPDLVMPVSRLHHQEYMAVSIYRGISGACSVPCHLETGLLQLAPGRPASASHTTLASDPVCACETCFQHYQILPHYPSAVFPTLASCSCLPSIWNADAPCQLWASSMT